MLLTSKSNTRLTAVRTGELKPSPMARSLGRKSAIGTRRSTRSANLCARGSDDELRGGNHLGGRGQSDLRGAVLALLDERRRGPDHLGTSAGRELLRLRELHARIQLSRHLVLAVGLGAHDPLDLRRALA